MSRTEELNARASAALEKYKSDFLAFVDNAAVAMPSNAEIPALKAAGLAVLEQACQSTLQAAGQAVSEADVAASQQLFLTQCQPAFGPVSEELVN